MAEDVMRNGYRQNTKGFGQLLRRSKPLDRALRYTAVQVAHSFRRELPRSSKTDSHSANHVRVEKRVPGGRRKDRMEMLVVAYDQKNYRNASRTLKKSLVYVSGGRTISRGGR